VAGDERETECYRQRIAATWRYWAAQDLHRIDVMDSIRLKKVLTLPRMAEVNSGRRR
jgi:hypothetical protein